MHIFREELKTTKASRKKLTQRLRAMRLFIFWHYILLALSGVNAAFVLFVALNVVNVPYREVMFVFSCASFGLSAYLLVSGLSTK